MRKLLLTSLLGLTALPLAAMAQQPCAHSAPRNLTLDLAGVKTVVFEVNGEDLVLQGAAGNSGALTGQACASDADKLPALSLTQAKSGDRLVVRLQRADRLRIDWGDRNYAYLKINGTVPDTVAVQVKVGSGDAKVTGVQSLTADVGSGDVTVRDVRGAFVAKVGSGDIEAGGVGSLNLLAIGSGDAEIERVNGAAKVGTIGSGDLELSGVKGSVDIASIGSGDAKVKDVTGNVTVGSIGSGDLEVDGVRGNLTVHDKSSGSISSNGVQGTSTLPRRD